MRNVQLIAVFIIGLLFLSCGTDPVTPPGNDSRYEQYGTPIASIPLIENIVMYEVNIRAFPNGNLQGVTERIDEIAALGVNVIWLMPIHPIGQINSVNSPYSVQDYKKVGSEYGTLDDLRALTDAAHARDIIVILDWVANHTAWDHPWISNADWYTQDGNGNIIHPPGTNWQDVADLDFGHPEMRLAMIDAMTYWVYEANVDGFRCDAADFVPFDFWEQALDSLTDLPGRNLLFLAEGARGDHFDAGFHLDFGWDWYGRVKGVFSGQPATGLFTTHQSEYSQIPAGRHKLRFTTNHDESAWDATPMTLFNGADGALAASVITTFMGGVPLIYGSQEVGRTANLPFFSNDPIDWNAHPDLRLAYEELMDVYTSSIVARRGTVTDHSTEDVACFSRSYLAEEMLVIVNVRGQSRQFAVPAQLQGGGWKNAFTDMPVAVDAQIALDGYGFLILVR
ncbi:MAG: alpha-amylase family glycosyl hydrolase [Saprospiraceae bacterium]|nr:alpha-amylase family glycosyl hydrolase [Saprospiraceae bacterium]